MEGQEKLASVQGCNINIPYTHMGKNYIDEHLFAKCKDFITEGKFVEKLGNYTFEEHLSDCMGASANQTEEMCRSQWAINKYHHCTNINLIQLQGNMNIPLNQYINKEELKKYKDGIYIGIPNVNTDYFSISDCSQPILYRSSNLNNITHVTYDNVDTLCIKTADEETLVKDLKEPDGYGDIYILNGPSFNCTKLKTSSTITEFRWNKVKLQRKFEDAYYNKTEGQTNEETDGPVNNIPKVKEVCGKIDVKELETIQGLSIASSVTSGIGAVGGVAGAITSGLSINKKESKGLDIASTITSAIGGATSTAGAVTSGIAAAKLKEIIDNIKKCKEEVSKLQ